MAHNLFRTSLEKLQKDPMKMRIKINTVYVTVLFFAVFHKQNFHISQKQLIWRRSHCCQAATLKWREARTCFRRSPFMTQLTEILVFFFRLLLILKLINFPWILHVS
jgi:hypothetical protein